MENDKEVKTSATIEDKELEIEVIPDSEDAEVLKAAIAKKDETIRQVLARAKAAEAKVKESKPAQETVKTEEKLINGANFDDALELRLQGHSKEAVDFIMKNGGIKSLDNPYVKAAVSAISEQSKAESSVKTKDTTKSEIEQKYTQEQINNMSANELYKILPKKK